MTMPMISPLLQRCLALSKEAIRSPEEIPLYLRRRWIGVHHQVRYRNTSRQKRLIHDFLDQEEFVLVVLDSCRYDYFEQHIDSYLPGRLEKAYTPVTATMQYIESIWDRQYELTYVTGMPAPTNHAFERKGKDHRPEEHFRDFVHVWQTCQSKELGAVPPETMTEVAVRTDADRKVVHYVQPHAPYIGEHRLREDPTDSSWGDSLQDIYRKIGRYEEDEKVISDDQLRRAYESNLERVLESVEELCQQVDVPVVITADHGELLGEDGRYIHGGLPHRHLCEVPWFTADETILGDEIPDRGPAEPDRGEVDERDVEEQLEQLGYL